MLILGHTGFVGRTVERVATSQGWWTQGVSLSGGQDLRDPQVLRAALAEFNPAVVINCAAHVGGLAYSRDKQGTIFLDNARMSLSQLEVMSDFPHIRTVNPIANCAYPGRLAVFSEGDFWDGAVHDSVLGYGGARRLAVLGSQVFRDEFGIDCIDVSLPNLYGPGDHLDPVRAHALGALVYRILVAQKDGAPEVKIWGSGKPLREWLFVEDAAEALILAADAGGESAFVNVGTGAAISVSDLATLIAETVGYSGDLVYDLSMPDGAHEKRMEAGLAKGVLGWEPKHSLRSGLEITVADVRQRLGMAS